MSWRGSVRTSLLYLVAILAGFSIAWLIVAFVVFPTGVVPRDVKVPNVTGLMYDEAQQRLAQAGFKAEQGEQRYNNSAPKMTVLEQSPAPGTREGIGNPITLVVSGGQRMATVPTVTGMTRIEAQVRLEQDGFDVGDVGEANSNAPRGQVIGTRPAAGSQVAVPSTISLILSRGAEATATQMPSLMGRDVSGARMVLSQLGVKDVSVAFDPMATGPAGTVVGQSPVPGATILPGATVQLRVSGTGTP
ncbi:MAG TPA: PASTA domain-containing protein [Gemmatimonadaceae bacterium]|nr:PASTA domain-containing protein [Gemmatimonadaceae bacterium]